MDIKKELVDDLNAVVTISITADDYADKVAATLRNQQKQAQLPGFRPGKVPFSLVKKKYGIAVKVDEINKVLNDTIYKYIQDEKLEILGNPIPKEIVEMDWDNQEDFEFAYDLGLAPQFDLKLSKRVKFTNYTIVPDEEMLQNQMKEVASRYGSMTSPEAIEGEDMVQVIVTGNFGEEEVSNESTVAIQRLKDGAKKSFLGKKAGDVVEANIEDIYEGKNEQATLIGKQPEDADEFKGAFKFEIKSISRLEPAEINQELFDKIFEPGTVTSEEEFKNKLKEDASKYLGGEAERKFKNDLIESLVEKTEISLPDEFLKKWLLKVSEKPLTVEQVEEDYSNYQKGLKWQLIENKIIKDNELKVEFDEIKAKTIELVNANMAQYGQPPMEKDQEDEIVQKVLSNQDEARRLNEMLYEDKVIAVIKDSVIIEEEEITYQDFIKLVSGN